MSKLKHPSRRGIDLVDPRPLRSYGGGNGKRNEVKTTAERPAAVKRKSDTPVIMEEDNFAGDALEELHELEVAACEAAQHGGDLGHECFPEADEEHQLLDEGWDLEDGPRVQEMASGSAAAAAEEDAAGREEPPEKRPRNGELVQVTVAASLDGIEARLRAHGETPRFRVVRAGLLQHTCTTAEAAVSYWPSTLAWSVEGSQRNLIEDALLAPT